MGDWELDRLREQSPGPGKRLLDEFATSFAYCRISHSLDHRPCLQSSTTTHPIKI